MRLWDPATTESLGVMLTVSSKLGIINALAWGELDGHAALASASFWSGTASLWDPATGKRLKTLPSNSISALAWGELGGRPVLASASSLWDPRIQLWGLAADDPVDLAAGSEEAPFTHSVTALAWGNLDGRSVLASVKEYGAIQLWDVTTAQPVGVLAGHTDKITALAWGELDGRPVLASAAEDNTMRLWDLVGLESPETPLIPDAGYNVDSLDWGEIGGLPVLASASWDYVVRLWEPGHPEPLGVLTAHTGPLTAVAWNRRGGRPALASGGWDKMVRLWDPPPRTAWEGLPAIPAMSPHWPGANSTAALCSPAAAMTTRCGSGTPRRRSS